MPKIAKGPYLKLRKQPGAKSIYYIIDNDSRKSTGFDAKQLPQAKQALEDHIRNRFIPKPSEDYYVQQALELYAHDVIPKHAKPIDAKNHIARLMEFFRGHTCDAVDPHLTASYERWRTHIGKASVNEPKRTRQPVKPESVRRELETLRAAFNHAWKCRRLKNQIPIRLPTKSASRERWLTRSEAARLLAGSLGMVLAPSSDIATRREHWTVWRRDRTAVNRHLAKFVLIGLRTGTRASAILSLGWRPHPDGGHFDLDHRLMFRAAPGERQTTKRKPPAPIPDKLLPHLKRWKRLSEGLYVITLPGTANELIERVSKAFRSAVARSGLDRAVTPHTLRHTCVTWLMRAGQPAWAVGGFVGMTAQMVERTYGHHSPSFLRETANAATISARAAE